MPSQNSSEPSQRRGALALPARGGCGAGGGTTASASVRACEAGGPGRGSKGGGREVEEGSSESAAEGGRPIRRTGVDLAPSRGASGRTGRRPPELRHCAWGSTGLRMPPLLSPNNKFCQHLPASQKLRGVACDALPPVARPYFPQQGVAIAPSSRAETRGGGPSVSSPPVRRRRRRRRSARARHLSRRKRLGTGAGAWTV